jgi:hypothetical protein
MVDGVELMRLKHRRYILNGGEGIEGQKGREVNRYILLLIKSLSTTRFCQTL